MNQVVRALEAFFNQRDSLKKEDEMQYIRMLKRDDDVQDLSLPSYKREGMDKMQYTRMGKRADDDVQEGMDKRDGMDKMQYTRMGKREDDLNQMRESEMRMAGTGDKMEEKIMKWGLLGKRENNLNKVQFTRMGKRDGMDKMQYTRMGKRENGKLQYTRMGKRNTGADEDLLGKTSAVKIFQ